MKSIKMLLCCLVVPGLVGLAADPALAQKKAKRKEIRKLLQLTGASAMARQVMGQMLRNLKPAFPKVPEAFWRKFAKKANTDELIDKLVPIYGRHLSLKDVKGLVAFYQSPVGRKYVAVQPLIVKDSMQVGRTWGIKLANQVVTELKKQGYKK